jgi:hypothetical protein
MQIFTIFPNQFKLIISSSIVVSTLFFSCGSVKNNKFKQVNVPHIKMNMRDSANKYYTFHQLDETLQAHFLNSTGVAKDDASLFLGSLQNDYRAYKPNKLVMDSIREILSVGNMLMVDVYGGNWCSDTRYGMGGLTHVLDDLGLRKSDFRYIRVDKDKKIIDLNAAGIEISLVPLVIFHIGKKEIGRIIENPMESWERNLLQLLKPKH